MSSKKSRAVTTLLSSVAALLMLLPPTISAQTLVEGSLSGVTHSVSVFHFNDGGDDIPGRLTTDANGNFYIAAQLGSMNLSTDFGVLKYNAKSRLQVIRYTNNPGEFLATAFGVKVDPQGNIYAAGQSSIGGLVVSFDPSGKQRWAQHTDGQMGPLVLDGSGNVYVIGTGGDGPFREWVIIKYTTDGQMLWERHHKGTADEDSFVTDIQLDHAGNPIVLGTTNNSLSLSNNVTTVKFDPQGNTLWVQDFNAVRKVGQSPQGLAVDGSGSVYITGTTIPPEGPFIPFTVKYDTNGNPQFALSGDGVGGASVAIDAAGDILLSGAHLVRGLPDVVTVSKLHADGTTVFVTQIGAAGKILPDSAGNFFVAATILNTGEPDYFITKLDPAGRELFHFRFKPGAHVNDAAIDPFGNLIVTGGGDLIGNLDIYTLKFPKNFAERPTH